MRKVIITITMVIVILVLSGAIMGALSKMKAAQDKKARVERLVHAKVVEVEYNDIISEIEHTGRVSSQHVINISSEVSGKIQQGNIPLLKGQSFKKGDLLFKINSEEMYLNVQAQKSRFLNLLANILPDIKIDYPERYEEWFAFFSSIKLNENISDLPEFKSEKEKIFLASKNILNDYFTIKANEARLRKYNIYAPYSGSIINLNAEPGAIANPGAVLASIIRTDKLEVEVPLSAEQASWIKIGDEVNLVSENNLESWTGKVNRKAGFVDAKTQSVAVFIQVNSSNKNKIYQGQYLRVQLNTKTEKNVMEIPRSAVFNGNEVYLVKNGVLKKEKIKVHKFLTESVIFSGLTKGDSIITNTLVHAEEELKVEVID